MRKLMCLAVMVGACALLFPAFARADTGMGQTNAKTWDDNGLQITLALDWNEIDRSTPAYYFCQVTRWKFKLHKYDSSWTVTKIKFEIAGTGKIGNSNLNGWNGVYFQNTHSTPSVTYPAINFDTWMGRTPAGWDDWVDCNWGLMWNWIEKITVTAKHGGSTSTLIHWVALRSGDFKYGTIN